MFPNDWLNQQMSSRAVQNQIRRHVSMSLHLFLEEEEKEGAKWSGETWTFSHDSLSKQKTWASRNFFLVPRWLSSTASPLAEWQHCTCLVLTCRETPMVIGERDYRLTIGSDFIVRELIARVCICIYDGLLFLVVNTRFKIHRLQV